MFRTQPLEALQIHLASFDFVPESIDLEIL
jgi:hypothetical protein